MFKFLTEDSKLSSTRVALFLGTVSACMILLAIVFHICYCTVHECAIEWSGAAMLVTSVAAFMGTMLYGKVQQKKYETTNQPNNITTVSNPFIQQSQDMSNSK